MGYSPDVEDGWTAPSEEGFSAEKALVEENSNPEVPFDESHVEHMASHEEEPISHSKRKKKNPYQKRIDQLVYEKGEESQQKAFLAQQLAESEAYRAQQQARINEYEAQLSQKDQYANEYFENSLSSHEDSLKDRLKRAKEDGDIESEVEIIDQLAEIKSTRAAHESWKIQEQIRKQKDLQEEEYIPYEVNLNIPTPPQNLEFQEWVAENQWYTNPKLKYEADAVADELSNILLFNNQSHLIGTNDFRDSVTNIMRERYGVQSSQNMNDEDNSSYYEPQRAPAVAPVTRSAATMAHNYMSTHGSQRNGRALSKEEYELARHLPFKKNNESEMDLIRRYQKAKSYPKSPLPGGSPYRLTIL